MEIPIFEVQFDKNGNVFQPQQEADIVRFLSTAPGNQTTDVVALSHGWNNDMDDARTLYRGFLGNLAAQLPADSGRKVIAIGVLWPSKKFAERDLIPSGAAAFDPFPVLAPLLADQLEQLKHTLGSLAADQQIDQLATLLPQLENSNSAQQEFVAKLGEIIRPHLDPAQVSPEEGGAPLANQNGSEVLQRLSAPLAAQPSVAAGGGGAAGLGEIGAAAAPAPIGGAAGLANYFDSVSAAASRLLNLTTYYLMKDRAGLVGRLGVNPMLSRIQATVPSRIRFHLVGHSFGGRLMTATVDGANRLRVNTLLLLQAAFSHNGFAHLYDNQHDGFFVRVVQQQRVSGRILVTHSDKDQAVGVAYPLAARLNGDTAAALGDANDIFGGIGRNGAQHIGDIAQKLTLLPAGSPYQFAPGKLVFNLNGDNTIISHGDVARAETSWPLATQILS